MPVILGTVGLKTAIWNNNLRSLILLAVYPAVMGLMIWALVVLYYLIMAGHASYYTGAPRVLPWNAGAHYGAAFILRYWPTILTVCAVWFLISLLFHVPMMRALSHATPVTKAEQPELYNLLENLCISRGLPTPRLEIIDSPALNAFSSGIDKKSYSVTVTRGLMETLEPDEMEAVLAHELTHILNNDVRLMVVSIIFVGLFGFAAQLLWSQLRWTLIFGGGRRDREDNNQLLLFLLAVEVVLWIGYMTTIFTRFALSRRRESMADEGAIELTKNPDAMMRALLRISGRDRIDHVSPDIARLCIENSRAPFFGLFADHPDIETRIRHISQITNTPIPVLSVASPAPSVGNVLPTSGKRNPWA